MAKLSSKDQSEIFSYSNSKSIFNYLYSKAGRTKPPTFGMWASRLGFKSPRIISMVLKGQRLASKDFVNSIAHDLGLSQKPKRYLELIVENDRYASKNKETPEEIISEIKQIRPIEYILLDESYLRVFSHWYYVPIRQLAMTGQLPASTKQIVEHLQGKVSAEQVEKALDDLIQLKIIKKKGAFYITVPEAFKTKYEMPSETIRNYHRAMMDRAREAIEEQMFSKRDLRALTFKINPKDFEKVKSRVSEFVDTINQEFYDEESKTVYQMNIQLFPLTK